MTTLLSCFPIDRDNIETLHALYGANVYRRIGGETKKFVVGKILILETIMTPDLFDATTTNVNRNAWICTRDEFEKMFVVIEQSRTLQGSLIRLK
jgi:hypothetical protein